MSSSEYKKISGKELCDDTKLTVKEIIMNTINMLANSIRQRIEDVGRQISQLLMEVNAVIARMNTTSDNYRRLAVDFEAPLVWDGGVVVPQTFEEHERSRAFFDLLSKAAFVLSIAYLLIGIYFSVTDDPYYLFLVLVIALAVALLWHFIIRSIAFRLFRLKPERANEARITAAEITAVSLAIAGFVGALVFAIGRATGDESGFLADYFIESLFVSDAVLLSASGAAHGAGDYYSWSANHSDRYETDRKLLFRLKEHVSKLTALLSHDLKQFEKIDEAERPPVTIPAEVVKVLSEYDKQSGESRQPNDTQPGTQRREEKPLLSEPTNEEVDDAGNIT